MTARAFILSGTVLGALVVGLAFALGPRRVVEGMPDAGKPLAGRAAAPTAAEPAPDPDPERIRDIFRFGGEAGPPVDSVTVEAPPVPSLSPAPGPPDPRLVGLVWKRGRLVAALALDGEVELAGPGESAAGVTVISAGQDSVVVRRPDGKEITLVLP